MGDGRDGRRRAPLVLLELSDCCQSLPSLGGAATFVPVLLYGRLVNSMMSTGLGLS